MSNSKKEKIPADAVKKPAFVTAIGAILSALPYTTVLELKKQLPEYYSQYEPHEIVMHTYVHQKSTEIPNTFLESMYTLRYNDPDQQYQKLHLGIDQFFSMYYESRQKLDQAGIRNRLQIATLDDCEAAVSTYRNAIKHIRRYGLGSFFDEIRNANSTSLKHERAAIDVLTDPKTTNNDRYRVLAYLTKMYPNEQFTQVVAGSELGIKASAETYNPVNLKDLDLTTSEKTGRLKSQ